ncbi:uncharacterized protein LTR77_002372 [Saxophila tyrrhenica]|uniref:Enoyl reductase (ER) domain-containing protein n=1 Tax=Saxophila tyrrhenica TaxID=1690608 RepID=A0AAV9PK51_9PEZI|nr:hypothetical protein LTR77_002372 [Saxophila tyrrhenica]
MASQAYQITSPSTLTLTTLPTPVPSPGPNEVLLRLHATSLNYRDILVIDHSPAYPVRAKQNLIPFSDGAGVISTVGPGSRWKAGDRVVLHPNPWLHGNDARGFDVRTVFGGGETDGTARRWMVVSDENLVKMPKGMGMEEASTMFTAGATAFRSLFHNGAVKAGPGVRVLTQGTGGVSCFAIMLAAAAGAEVVATSSSDEKLEFAKKLGATHLINYRKHPDWDKEVLSVTDGKGVDLVCDVVGAGSIEKTIKATAFGGFVSVMGMLGEDFAKPVDIMTDLLFGAKTLQGQLGASSREVFEEMSAFMEKHDLHPPVAQVFEFEQAEEALKALTTLTVPGKIVVRC